LEGFLWGVDSNHVTNHLSKTSGFRTPSVRLRKLDMIFGIIPSNMIIYT